jgi:hypothetical protein
MGLLTFMSAPAVETSGYKALTLSSHEVEKHSVLLVTMLYIINYIHSNDF